MALYGDEKYLTKVTMRDFEVLTKGAELTPISGIYRCEQCGWEIVIDAGQNGRRLPKKHLPFQSHQGPIQWRLIVTDSSTLDEPLGNVRIIDTPSTGKDEGSSGRQ